MEENKGKYVLTWKNSKYFADGFQVLRKVTDDVRIKYYYGQYEWNDDNLLMEWDLNDLDLCFEPLETEHQPTFGERIRKCLFGREYPKTDENRPDNNSIVICEYCGGTHYEVVEYGSHIWATELYLGIKPDRFARFPNNINRERCLEFVKNDKTVKRYNKCLLY